MRLCLVRRFEEPLERNRFHEIVEGIQFEAFDGILPVGSGENGHGRPVERAEEIGAREVGHLDVEKEQIDGPLPQNFIGLQSPFAGADQFEERSLPDVSGDALPGHGFVVDDKAGDGHCLNGSKWFKMVQGVQNGSRGSNHQGCEELNLEPF